MNRREFFRKSAVGASGMGLAASAAQTAEPRNNKGAPGARLFPTSLPSHEWVQFRAAGYSAPACGVIYRRADQVQHGMPLGGVSTGFVDIDTNGTLGLTSLFNSGVPVFGPLRAPFLGVNVGSRTWVLTLDQMVGPGNAQEIHYWGHYPIADVEYKSTSDVPVRSASGWSPFIPGDAKVSNTPAADL